MSTKRIVSLVGSVLVLVALFSATSVFAQNSVPAVYVQNLKIAKTEVSVGQTVNGTFTLNNQSTVSAGNVSYIVTLLGKFVDGKPTATLDQKILGPVFIGPREKENVSFSYKLPSTVSGKVALEIRARSKAGTLMGWQTTNLTVAGEAQSEPLTLSKAVVVVDDQEFGAQVGPTVKKGQTVSLDITLANEGATDVVLTPTITINDFNAGGKEVKKYTEKAITIVGKEDTATTFVLPLFDNNPGVYEGILSFKDSANKDRLSLVFFRYIIAGDIATIQSVSTNKPTVQKGDSIEINVSFVGTPVDITENPELDDQNAKQAVLKVGLYNTDGKLLGVAETNVTLTSDIQTKKLSIVAGTSADALVAKAIITADGKTIASFENPISEVKPNAAKKGISSIVYLILLALAIILTLYFIAKDNRINKRAALSIAIILAGGALATGIMVHAYAEYEFLDYSTTERTDDYAYVQIPDGVASATSQQSWCSGCNGMSIYINDLQNSDGTTYQLASQNRIYTNSTFKVAGYFNYLACGNFPIDPTVTYSIDNGSTQNASISTNCDKKQELCPGTGANRTTDFTISNVKFTTPGEHKIHVNLQVRRDFNYTGTNPPDNEAGNCIDKSDDDHPNYWLCPAFKKFQMDLKFTVVDQVSKPTNVVATPQACGQGKINLTWTAPLYAQSYNIWDNGVQVATGVTNTSYSRIGLGNSETHTFQVEAVNGTAKTKSDSVTAVTAGDCQLDATFSASPDSGLAPLNDVTLAVPSVTGNTLGDVTYNFDCGEDGNSDYERTVTTSATTYTATNLCSYASAGNYTPRVYITRGNKNVTKTDTVTVTAPQLAPTVDLKVNGSDGSVTITKGASANLTWSSTDAVSCTSGNYWTAGPKPVSSGGSGESTGSLNTVGSYMYTLTCTNNAGSDSDSVTVTVEDSTPVAVSCYPTNPADGTRVGQAPVGQPVKWVADNDNIVLNGKNPPNGNYVWSGSVSASGSNLKSVTRVYTTVGLKQVSVSVDGGPLSSCDAGNFTVSNQPGYKEF